MGYGGGRVIEEALAGLREEVLDYLGQEVGRTQNDLIALASEGERKACPRAFSIYLVFRQEGLPLVAGGFFDQPYLLSRIMHVCRECLDEHQVVMRINQANTSANSPA